MQLVISRCRGLVPALLLALVFGCRPETNVPELAYQISRSTWDSLPALQVRVSFQPSPGSFSRLHFSDKAWGQDSLWNTVKEVRVLSGQGEPVIHRDSGWVEIKNGAGDGPLEIGYKIIQDQPVSHDPSLSYRPIVQPGYFHVFAHNLLMVPGHYQEPEGARAIVRLSWQGWEEPP